MLRSGVELPSPSTLWIARKPTFAVSITADCQIRPKNISFVNHLATGEAYGSDRSHPVILQVTNEASPAIVVDLFVNPDPAEMFKVDWRGEEEYPRQDVEQEGSLSVRVLINTAVRVKLGVTLSMETHEALPTCQDVIRKPRSA